MKTHASVFAIFWKLDVKYLYCYNFKRAILCIPQNLWPGFYVPDNIVTNHDLSKLMDTDDAWIQERTGIKERRWIKEGSVKDTTATMGVKAAKIAIERAGIDKDEIDFIVFATLSPDYYFQALGLWFKRNWRLKRLGLWMFGISAPLCLCIVLGR